MKSPVKVLIVAEGPSEIGQLDASSPRPAKRSRAKPAEGFIPPIVRKVLGKWALDISAQRVAMLGRWSKRRLPGHADRAASALAIASALDYDLLVFVKDVDRESGTKRSELERKRKIAALQSEIDEGFSSVLNAEHVRRAKGTPCRMIEAWALGDPNALPKSGQKAKRLEPVPGHPETLWGAAEDPSSNHPKRVLERVLGREASATTFEEIALEADINTLERSCPDTFEPFVGELRAARVALE